jgi:hypothetical protein
MTKSSILRTKLSLCLIKHHSIKTFVESGGTATRISSLITTKGDWLAALSNHFGVGTHWIEGCEDLRAGLDAVEKRKIFPARNESPIIRYLRP